MMGRSRTDGAGGLILIFRMRLETNTVDGAGPSLRLTERPILRLTETETETEAGTEAETEAGPGLRPRC